MGYVRNPHKAIIIAGPSGSGKTTITKHLLRNNTNLNFSVSACTRAKRKQEVHGKDYYFISTHEFKRKIAEGAFFEWKEVYVGDYYGTLKTEVANIRKANKAVIFDTDVRGGIQLKSYFKEHALAVYIKVPSIKLLAERLRKRKTEREEKQLLRMSTIEEEASLVEKFDVILINSVLQDSLNNIQKISDEFLAK